jgi:hypothetical protein
MSVRDDLFRRLQTLSMVIYAWVSRSPQPASSRQPGRRAVVAQRAGLRDPRQLAVLIAVAEEEA